MSINYKQLKDLVLQELVGDGPGGEMGASAPADVPHRMPAADPPEKEQDMGDDKANELYEVALVAREATEKLVEALDEPIYDGAYEHAFKASACLRRCLNELVGVGAHPMPWQRVVAAPRYQQKYSGQGRNNNSAGDFAGGMAGAGFAMPLGMQEEAGDDLKGFGAKMTTQSQQAKGELERSKEIAGGKILGGVDNKERGMLTQIEKILTKIADEDDLTTYRPNLQAVLKQLLAVSSKKSQQGKK